MSSVERANIMQSVAALTHSTSCYTVFTIYIILYILFTLPITTVVIGRVNIDSIIEAYARTDRYAGCQWLDTYHEGDGTQIDNLMNYIYIYICKGLIATHN